jgi:hypothetical protein
MSKRIFIAAAAIAAAAASPAVALDWLHTQVKVGSKTCFASHYHHIESGAFASRGEAEAAATRRWENFTRNEYGAAWASLARADAKGMDCAQGKNTRGTVWSCKLKAKPCRA